MSAEANPNPWEKSSLLLGGIWLVFLAFPIATAWQADAALWARVATIAALVTFAFVYLHGYTVGDWERVTWPPAIHLAIMLVIAVATYPMAGLNGPITCAIFMMAYTVFVFPLAVSLAVAFAIHVTMWLIVVLTGNVSEWGYLMALGAMVGIGVTAARMTEQRGERYQETERQLVAAQERERVARDVHDLLGHTLTAITVKAELAEKLIDADPSRARTEVTEIQQLSREAITEVRQTVGALRARRLDAELLGATTALADAGIAVEVPEDVSIVEPRLRMLFAWVVREATTNVLRHSNATRCWIELGQSHVSIADDGRGSGTLLEGNGLKGLRERVEEAGGALSVSVRDGGGTIVAVTA